MSLNKKCFEIILLSLLLFIITSCGYLILNPTHTPQTSTSEQTMITDPRLLTPSSVHITSGAAITQSPTVTSTPFTPTIPSHSLTPAPVKLLTATASPMFLPTPTFIKTALPDGLKVVFIADDTLYSWTEEETIALLTRKSIFSPSLSDDGKWVVFHQQVKNEHPRYEVWAVRSDGSDLHRLLSTDEITSLAEEDSQIFIDEISWIPDDHQLVFNTQEVIEGPPGSRRNFDLYLLNISGEITTLADYGEGGDFLPSPNGRYLAVAKPKRIGVIDLETGINRTLLEIEPLVSPSGPPGTPILRWNKTSTYITTTIPPKYIYYPDMYSGKPEQIWRLDVNGHAELLIEVKPIVGWPSVVSLSPDAEYYFYFERGKCLDGGMVISHLRSLSSGEEILNIPCTFYTPEWTPGGEYYLYKHDGVWMLGNIEGPTAQPLELFDLPAALNIYPPLMEHWINDAYFLLRIQCLEKCNLVVGSLDGFIALIYQSPTKDCPGTDFSVSN